LGRPGPAVLFRTFRSDIPASDIPASDIPAVAPAGRG